jgi:hypothetical protein
MTLLAFFASLACAVDYGGADLVPANGSSLGGTFTNVGHFEIGFGVTVQVDPGVPLEIHADTILVDGTLDAVGAGDAGGPFSLYDAGPGRGQGGGGVPSPRYPNGGGGGG